jgi:hypothetical protein
LWCWYIFWANWSMYCTSIWHILWILSSFGMFSP